MSILIFFWGSVAKYAIIRYIGFTVWALLFSIPWWNETSEFCLMMLLDDAIITVYLMHSNKRKGRESFVLQNAFLKINQLHFCTLCFVFMSPIIAIYSKTMLSFLCTWCIATKQKVAFWKSINCIYTRCVFCLWSPMIAIHGNEKCYDWLSESHIVQRVLNDMCSVEIVIFVDN